MRVLLEHLAGFTHRRRLPLLIVFVVLLVGAAIYGAGATKVLEAGGFEDPNSESARAERMLQARFGLGQPDVVVAYSHETAKVSDPEFARPLQATIAKLRARPEIGRVAPSLTSKDGHIAIVSIQLKGPYEAVEPLLQAPGLSAQVGGLVPATRQAQAAAAHDLERGELIALPLVALLLIVFFRGFVIAALPLLIGGFAITWALACLRALASFTSVSIFALNIATFVGFGVAVDYSLFMTSRFRDELHAGLDVPTALRNTIVTAGRTITNSGVAVAVSMLGVLVFPIPLLKSVAISGAIVVTMAVLATLLFLPAALAALGPRLDWLSFRSARSTDRSVMWSRIAHAVMRAPALVAVGTTLVLLLLGAPFLRLKESVAGARVLPQDSQARQVADLLASDRFPRNVVTPIDVALTAASRAALDLHVAEVSKLPHLQHVRRIDGQGGPPYLTALSLISDAPPESDAAVDLIHRIRALATPGVSTLVGGDAAHLVDLRASLDSRLPLALGLICLATFVVLFLAFRSVVVPLKAIVMNVLSLTASFGALVFIFQDGRLQKLLHYRSNGSIELTIPVVMFAVVFGLAMDYELFLLSRIREAWDLTGDGRVSVAIGLEQTGRIITRAALLVIAVMVGFMSADMLLIKELGVGMAIAIAVDATIVRALLVPATMQLLGRYNWWAPRWMKPRAQRVPSHTVPPQTQVP